MVLPLGCVCVRAHALVVELYYPFFLPPQKHSLVNHWMAPRESPGILWRVCWTPRQQGRGQCAWVKLWYKEQ